jgi:hypothetical protein
MSESSGRRAWGLLLTAGCTGMTQSRNAANGRRDNQTAIGISRWKVPAPTPGSGARRRGGNRDGLIRGFLTEGLQRTQR